ncbi:MAG: Coq4 family protein [Cyanobacteria bacterium J06633_8]
MLTEDKSVVETPRVEKFFNFIDNVSEARGKNVPQIVEIEKLRSFPEGTLGKVWANFLDDNDLQPLTTGFRRKQLHDGVHVLTGYDSSSIGEAELQAFLLGAKFGLFNLLIAVGLLRQIRKGLPNQTKEAKQKMWKAYQRGKSCNFNPDTWEPELLWDLTLDEVRAKFGV